jgi:queuosine precursor transporter
MTTVLLSLLYVVATLVANYTADWFLPIGAGVISVATLVFSVTFFARDRLHEESGRSGVYLSVLIALIANVAMSIGLGVPARIIAASFTAIAVAEFADTEIYARMHKSWIHKVAVSNAVSVPLDTLLFTLAAFLGVLPGLMLVQIVIGETLVKYAIALLMSRVIEPRQATNS